MANSFDSLVMTTHWVLGEASALVYAHRDVWPCGLLQEVQFTNDTVVVKVRRHVRAIGVLMEQIRSHCRCCLGVGSTLKVQILDYRINHLRL